MVTALASSSSKKDVALDMESNRRINQFDYFRLMNQLCPTQIATTLRNFVKTTPRFLWSFFVEAFLVPSYRPEWLNYSSWKPRREVLGKEERSNENEVNAKHGFKQRRKLLKMSRSTPKPVLHNHSLCSKVTINVSGKIYQLQRKTLLQFPNTLLGNPARLAQFYDPQRDDHFIDRHRTCFDAIIYYYQSRGILRKPYNVSVEIFEDEVRFFDLGQDLIDKLRRDEGLIIDVEKPIPRVLLQRKLWLLFEYPESSYQARVVAVMSVLVIILSIMLFCLETCQGYQLDNSNADTNLNSLVAHTSSLSDPFFFTETTCMCWFVFEFLIRAITAPGKVSFFKTISNLIDLVAILPYFLSLAMTSEGNVFSKATSITVIRIVRLVRVFRILKLSRHNRGLKVLGKTLRASIRELGLLMFFLGIGVILFSSAVYFAELHEPESHFKSIIGAFWWSIITMTTCGYGDHVPRTVLGKIIGALCAIAGVLTLALPVPVIVSNFNSFYTREDNSVKVSVESNHVAQCPFRAGYTKTDELSVNQELNESAINASTDKEMARLDVSDSQFESLKKKEFAK